MSQTKSPDKETERLKRTLVNFRLQLFMSFRELLLGLDLGHAVVLVLVLHHLGLAIARVQFAFEFLELALQRRSLAVQLLVLGLGGALRALL